MKSALPCQSKNQVIDSPCKVRQAMRPVGEKQYQQKAVEVVKRAAEGDAVVWKEDLEDRKESHVTTQES